MSTFNGNTGFMVNGPANGFEHRGMHMMQPWTGAMRGGDQSLFNYFEQNPNQQNAMLTQAGPWSSALIQALQRAGIPSDMIKNYINSNAAGGTQMGQAGYGSGPNFGNLNYVGVSGRQPPFGNHNFGPPPPGSTGYSGSGTGTAGAAINQMMGPSQGYASPGSYDVGFRPATSGQPGDQTSYNGWTPVTPINDSNYNGMGTNVTGNMGLNTQPIVMPPQQQGGTQYPNQGTSFNAVRQLNRRM